MKVREVLRKDVRDAALIGQIIAEADLAEAGVICVVDDDDCCGHMLAEHCIAAAVGASEAADRATLRVGRRRQWRNRLAWRG